MNINRIQVNIFKLYILLLPITEFHPLKLNNYFGAMATSTVFILHVIGMMLIFIEICRRKRIKTNKFMKYISFMILFLNFISLFMALILHDKLGVLYGEDTYRACIGDIIYYTQLIFIFYYNYIMGNKLKKEDFFNLFYIVTIYELIIGYLQVLILNGVPLVAIHNALSKIGIVADISEMQKVEKIFLTASEPANISHILGFIILPYLLTMILCYRRKRKYILLLLLYLPISYFSKSSTVYITVAIEFFAFIILIIKKYNISNKMIINTLSFFIVIFLAVFFGEKYINQGFINEIRYTLIEKVSDTNNMSTVFRDASVRNNQKVFMKYPILGIGNGLQGYYFEENLEPYAYASEEIKVVLTGEKGIPSGGSFFTSYLSAYGLVGIILLLVFIYMSIKRINKKNELYYIYVLGGVCFVATSQMTLGITGNYIAIFIVSIPLFNEK